MHRLDDENTWGLEVPNRIVAWGNLLLGSAPETKAAEQFYITNRRAATPGSLDKPRFAPVGFVQRLCASLSPNILRLSAMDNSTERTHLVAG